MDDRYEQLEPLEPGIARVLARNPSPFTFTGTQTYLLGEREVAVIDPGPADTSHVDAIVSAIAGRPIVAILCTHTHRDHSPAAAEIAARTGAPVAGCAPLVLEGAETGVEAAFDLDYSPDRVLADGEHVVVDGKELTAVATPGHTSNHLCFAWKEALFTGDHVMGWSTTVVIPPDGDMAAYMRSLQKLRERTDRIYYPAHGPAVSNPQQYVRHLASHRVQREQQILGLVGGTARAIPEIVERAYPELDPRLRAAAGASVLAHLLDLERRDLVVREGDLWTGTRYASRS